MQHTLLFWEDSDLFDTKTIELQVFSNKGFVFIQNIWEGSDEFGKIVPIYADSDSWIKFDKWGGAAMYSEDIPNGKRYFCNDGVPDDDFDDIIFTVERID